MKRDYSLFRRSGIHDEWQFVTSISAWNIMDAEDKFEDYLMTGFHYMILRST